VFVAVFAASAASAARGGLLAAQATAPYAAPRTLDGKPDLQGIWMTRNAAAFDVSEVAEGHQIPYLPDALEREQRGDRVDPIAHCSMPGVPRVTYMPFPFQILQRPGYVVFLFEYQHNDRIVATTPRAHLEDIDFYLGDSVGRWEGDTLVIDVTNLSDKTWLDSARHTHSDALHVVERYRRTDHDNLQLQLTIDDPKAYTKPWTVTRAYRLKSWDIGEDVCVQANEKNFEQGIVKPASAPSH
jgi:hypothetical protein